MPMFLKFQAMVKRLLNSKIESVQIDWGGPGVKYRNLRTYFQSIGIIHRVLCPHTHQQQGCAKRKHSWLF
jgi:isopentenyl diphosphate isomerase/L-lactate dehydrogenase-like FMN-dependent dehydrogenase